MARQFNLSIKDLASKMGYKTAAVFNQQKLKLEKARKLSKARKGVDYKLEGLAHMYSEGYLRKLQDAWKANVVKRTSQRTSSKLKATTSQGDAEQAYNALRQRILADYRKELKEELLEFIEKLLRA